MTTAPFTTFEFRSTGATANRTAPDRFGEIKNVKDFGALGNFSNDDTTAIQAAVNWTSGANRGTIYFPLGQYKVTSPITFNYDGDLSICFRGEIGTQVFGDIAGGYIFDRHLATPNNTTGGRIFEKLQINNSSATGGCLRLGSTNGGVIRDCGFGGFICLTTEDAVGESSQSILIENCAFGWNGVGGDPTGSHYIIIGGGGVIQGCILTGADTAVRAYGSGLSITGCRSENCNTSFLFGVDSGDNPVGLSGFSVVSTTTEGCWTGFDLGGDGGGLCEGFVMSIGHLGHDEDNAGVIKFIQPSQYGIRVRADCARAGIIHSSSFGQFFEVAGVAIGNATSRGDLVVREVISNFPAGGGAHYIYPTNAYTAKFVNNNESPTWTYSQLGSPLEGDEFNITDCNTATWGATAAGGGSNHVLVRYNGTNWTVVGK